jgi:hypothetical protein
MVTAGFHHATWLFAGAVTPAVLERAANSMINDLNHFRFRRPPPGGPARAKVAR